MSRVFKFLEHWQVHVTVGVAILAVAASAFSVQTYRTATQTQLNVNAFQHIVNTEQGVQNTQLCTIARTLAKGQVKSLTNLVASSNEFRHYSFAAHTRVFFQTSFAQREAALAKAKKELVNLKC